MRYARLRACVTVLLAGTALLLLGVGLHDIYMTISADDWKFQLYWFSGLYFIISAFGAILLWAFWMVFLDIAELLVSRLPPPDSEV